MENVTSQMSPQRGVVPESPLAGTPSKQPISWIEKVVSQADPSLPSYQRGEHGEPIFAQLPRVWPRITDAAGMESQPTYFGAGLSRGPQLAATEDPQQTTPAATSSSAEQNAEELSISQRITRIEQRLRIMGYQVPDTSQRDVPSLYDLPEEPKRWCITNCLRCLFCCSTCRPEQTRSPYGEF